MLLEITKNSQENTCLRVSFLIFNLLVPGGNKRFYVLRKTLQLKETPTLAFPSDFCEIFKNTFFIEHLRWLHLNAICVRGIFLKHYTETGTGDLFKYLMVLNKVESYPTPPLSMDIIRMIKSSR